MAASTKLLPSALLLLEGETEEELYTRFCNHFAPSTPKHFKNLRGNFNINAKIADAATTYMVRHPDRLVDVFVCIDQERIGIPAFNKGAVEDALKAHANFHSIIPIVAVLTLESLFFLDLDGIYKFLRAKRSKRNFKRFANFRALNHRDLSDLFRQFDKTYFKGHRCDGLVAALCLEKLLKADELLRLKTALVRYQPHARTRGKGSTS
jgi:hypothetical protein